MTSDRINRYWMLVGCCAICFLCFVVSYMRMPLFPLFAASLGVGIAQVGLVSAVYLLLAGILSIPAGVLSDRIGRRLPVMSGLFILSFSSFLLARADGAASLLVVCLLSGIGTALFAPPLMSCVADITPPARLGSAFGWFTMSLYAGMTFGPAFGGVAAKFAGYRPVFLFIAATLFGLVWISFLLLPSSPAWKGAPKGEVNLAVVLKVLNNRRLLVCLLTMFGSCIGYGMFIIFMPLDARSLGLDSAHIGYIFAAQALANGVSRIPFGRLGDRMEAKNKLVVAGLAGFTVSLAAFAYATSFPLLLVCAVAFGVTMGMAFTALVSLTVDAAPPELRGLAIGLYNSCLYLGMAFASLVMGVVIAAVGYRVAFLSCAFACVVCLGIFVFVYRREPAPVADEAVRLVDETGQHSLT